MTRDAGFPHADIDVGFLRDVKVRRLRQHVPAEDVPATTVLYLALVLSSWAEGDRLNVADADSPVDATPERLEALRAVGLIDDDGYIPGTVWESWFRPAWERRERKRAGGREGNARRWGNRSDSDSDSDSDSESQSLPSLPSLPSNPSLPSPDAWEGFGPEWSPFLEAWRERFRLPPSGAPDRARTQRAVLWEIVGGFPLQSAAWCRSAPRGASSHEVVAHVRAQWRKATERPA